MRATEVVKHIFKINKNIDGNSIDNLKLNELLYRVQGQALAEYGVQAFEDPIVALKHGPVVATVYSEYSRFKKEAISEDRAPDNNVDVKIIFAVCDVLMFNNEKSGIALSRESKKHENPWYVSFNEYNGKTISLDSIKDFFSKPENKIPSFAEKIKDMDNQTLG